MFIITPHHRLLPVRAYRYLLLLLLFALPGLPASAQSGTILEAVTNAVNQGCTSDTGYLTLQLNADKRALTLHPDFNLQNY